MGDALVVEEGEPFAKTVCGVFIAAISFVVESPCCACRYYDKFIAKCIKRAREHGWEPPLLGMVLLTWSLHGASVSTYDLLVCCSGTGFQGAGH